VVLFVWLVLPGWRGPPGRAFVSVMEKSVAGLEQIIPF